MSTRHQKRAGVRFGHDTEWTVVLDPPNDCASQMCFETESLADQYLANVKARGIRDAYKLAPRAPRKIKGGPSCEVCAPHVKAVCECW